MFKEIKMVAFLLVFLLASITLFWSFDIRGQLFNDYTIEPTVVKGVEFPKTLIDGTGEAFLLEAAPGRIVSITLATDEILSALVSEDRVVGVTHLVDDLQISNIPNQYSTHIKRINGGIEEILALEPDLVLITRYTRAETVRLLLAVDIPVVRLTGDSSFADIEENILTLGQVTGTQQRAQALVDGLRAETEKITDRINGQSSPRVLFYSLNGFTEGVGTTVDEMIQIAGGINIAREAGIRGSQKISTEMAIGLEPDIILMSGLSPRLQTSPADQLMQDPNWQHVPAVRNHRVYDLQGHWLVSVSQYSWDGIKEIAELLHPEVFK